MGESDAERVRSSEFLVERRIELVFQSRSDASVILPDELEDGGLQCADVEMPSLCFVRET
jgi:hypothetical protein